jgi:hypothetical protein
MVMFYSYVRLLVYQSVSALNDLIKI